MSIACVVRHAGDYRHAEVSLDAGCDHNAVADNQVSDGRHAGDHQY